MQHSSYFLDHFCSALHDSLFLHALLSLSHVHLHTHAYRHTLHVHITACAHFTLLSLFTTLSKTLLCTTNLQRINLTKSSVALVILGTQIQKQRVNSKQTAAFIHIRHVHCCAGTCANF